MMHQPPWKKKALSQDFHKSSISCSYNFVEALVRCDPAFAFPLQSLIEPIQFFLVGRLERTMSLPEVRRLRLLVFPVLEESPFRLASIRISWW
jgi:hypothetical protein